MAKTAKSTTEKVREIVLPVCREMELDLWDVTFEKEGADWFLKVLIEKKEGLLDITEAEAFSRRIDPLIDEADPIDQSYFLEVGSPGIGRKLRTPEHFERFVGSEVYVRLIRPDSEGRKELEGTLSSFSDGSIRLGDIDIRLADTAFVRLND